MLFGFIKMHENNRKLLLDTSQTSGHLRVALTPHIQAFNLRYFIRKSYMRQLQLKLKRRKCSKKRYYSVCS